jgi:hypothetical protein
MLVWPSTIQGETRVLTATWRDKVFSGGDQANYSSTAISIGAVPSAGHTRHVVVIAMAVSTGSGTIFDTMELTDGFTTSYGDMTILENFSVVIDGQRYKAVVGIKEMTTQTSVVVVVHFSGNQMECSIALWTLEDLLSATPHDVATNSADDQASVSLSIDIPGGGICVAMAHVENPQTWTSFTGTGSNLRENSNSTIAIDVRPETFQDELLLTADPVAATIDQVVIAASFL